MELNLREAIVQRVIDRSPEELQAIIDDSMHQAEMTLPGLGVLFEIIWSNSAPEEQARMVGTLHSRLSP
ncbi:small acid-soluble spore protein SspI [Cohnella sp. GCM10027633]|uniref:small acid-soluble spore protein SspI n=1 Tax=unclassified Cohnella TaxID=2636738 RepID=UPI003639B9FD